MAEEEVVTAEATIPSPADLKRKHHVLDPEGPEPNVNGEESMPVERAVDEKAVDVKRPHLNEEKLESLVFENGFQEDKTADLLKKEEEPSGVNNTETEFPRRATEEAPEGVDAEQPSTDDRQGADIQPPVEEHTQLESEKQPETECQEPSAKEPRHADGPSGKEPPASETESMSRKMEVPNDKVGVLIGKGGETIRYLQLNSGAKIQITRDADVDPQSINRPVELIGGLENINKAEKLIKDVIAEADAGGSPALVARGFNVAQSAGDVEQVLIQVPNEKVGVIIGKGGETIKTLQTRSGARIQLIPQHLPDTDQSKERTVRVSGDKRQIERAWEMIKEVMNQPARQSSLGGYHQQSFPPRGPSSRQQWGPRGPNASQPSGYDYQQRGPYPSQNSPYPPCGYGNYPPHAGSRSNYGSEWEQRPHIMPGPPRQGGSGYDCYGGQGQMGGALPSGPHSNPHAGHGPGSNQSNMGPPSQGNYNYGQPHGQQASYPAQGYSHGYGENKYENRGPGHHHPYSGSQPWYGKLAPYGMPPHGSLAQNYGQPRASQPGDVPYQGGLTQQPYGQNSATLQQSCPVAGSSPVPQNYPYGLASATDRYNQLQPAPGFAQMYSQQSGQPVGQQGPGYGQLAGYGSYPAQQEGYGGDQPAQNNVGYGYQGGADPAYGGGAAYGAQPASKAGYAQPVPVHPGYDQSAGGYSGVPAGYGTSVSPQPGYPQPGYDAPQM